MIKQFHAIDRYSKQFFGKLFIAIVFWDINSYINEDFLKRCELLPPEVQRSIVDAIVMNINRHVDERLVEVSIEFSNKDDAPLERVSKVFF